MAPVSPPALLPCRDVHSWNDGNAIMLNKTQGDRALPYAGDDRLDAYLTGVSAYLDLLRCDAAFMVQTRAQV